VCRAKLLDVQERSQEGDGDAGEKCQFLRVQPPGRLKQEEAPEEHDRDPRARVDHEECGREDGDRQERDTRPRDHQRSSKDADHRSREARDGIKRRTRC
jgi:hypothetical protein